MRRKTKRGRGHLVGLITGTTLAGIVLVVGVVQTLRQPAGAATGEGTVVTADTSGSAAADAPNAAGDWRSFRGTAYNHTTERNLPTSWSATENVAWRADLPGMGTSSPIVVGNKVILTAYDGYGLSKENAGDAANLTRHVIAVDRETGNVLWDKPVRSVNDPHPFRGFLHLHGYASHTPTTDGERVFVHLGNSGVYAFDLDGEQLWHTSIGTRTSGFGTAASPIVNGEHVIVNASIEKQRLMALERETGEIAWEAEVRESYGTPIVVTANGRDELVVPSHRKGLVGIDARTGRELWNCAGQKSDRYICGSPILVGDVVVGTGSVDGPLVAVRPGGSGDVTGTERNVWKAGNFAADCTSPIHHDGRIYWMNSSGYAIYDAETGEIVKRGRPEYATRNGGLYSTPLVAGDVAYIQSQFEGTWVVKLDDDLTTIAHNRFQQGRPRFPENASPVAHDGQLLIRTNDALYCIGE